MTASLNTSLWNASDYAEHYITKLGFGLVPIPTGQKGPCSVGWNKPENALSDPKLVTMRFRRSGENMGLLHSVSGTAVIDVDSPDHVTAALAAVGLDWPELLAQNPWRIKGQKGEKPVFRLPKGLTLKRRALTWPAHAGQDEVTVFELRAGSVQDVLPPSIHPVSGQPYTWVNGVPPHREALPLLPEAVLRLWLEWDLRLPALRAACPWNAEDVAASVTPQGMQAPMQGSVIEVFNARHTPGELLERAGYVPQGTGSWIFPGSTSGTAGVHTLGGSDAARVYSHHAADPLNTGHAHDAFSVFTHLNHGGDVKAAVKEAARELGLDTQSRFTAETQEDAPYEIRAGAVYWNKRTREGVTSVKLTNFTARIVEETMVDDGAERRSELCIEGHLEDHRPLPRIRVPAEQYGSLNWITEKWGVRPIVNAGNSVRQHLAVALQTLSQANLKESTIYAHTGWRDRGHEKVFITGKGALGAQGQVEGVSVDLPKELSAYVLPEPATGKELAQAVKLSLNTWTLADDTVTIPLSLSTLRPVLGKADFSVLVVGKTGLGKTQLAAVMSAHFGANISAQGFPGWHSTANYLERLAYLAKDLPLVIDDFNPTGSRTEQARYHATAERLLRAQGNLNGRGRLNDRAAMRVTQEPRGLLIITAEDLPKGHSALARALVLRLTTTLTQGDASASLSEAQAHASAGVYARMTAAFVQWLIPQLKEIQDGKAAFVSEHRSQFQATHARTVNMTAELLWTWQVFERFAVEAAGLTEAEATLYRTRVLRALKAVATQQILHQENADPTQRAVLLFQAGLATRAFHLEDASGETPENPEHYGWQRRTLGMGTADYFPQGKCVGWLTETEVYLHPVQAYLELQRLADAEGEAFTTSRETLWRHFQQAGLMRAWDDKRTTVKRPVRGQRMRVLVLSRTVLGEEANCGARGAVDAYSVRHGEQAAPSSVTNAPDVDFTAPLLGPASEAAMGERGVQPTVHDTSYDSRPACPTPIPSQEYSYELE